MDKSGFAEDQRPYQDEPRSVAHLRLKIDSAGRIVIPAEMRAAMLARPGGMVTAHVIDGELRIVSPTVSLKRVQAFGRKWKTENPDVSVVDELIADRREEARRDDERFERLEREGAGPRSGEASGE